jgi:hypothetical protein
MTFEMVWVVGNTISGQLTEGMGQTLKVVHFKITADELYKLISTKNSSVNLTGESLDRIIEKQG